ncbi:thiamine-triphosphatase isoform 1-T2 [Polymixia lowei]
MSVEVERKFVCDADIQKTLEGIGAVCLGQRQFHDQYFDTPDFDLTLRDLWLRKRKGCWELKCPTTIVSRAEETHGEEPKEASLCTRYKEITSLPEIQLKVKQVLKSCLGGQIQCQPPERVIEDERNTATQEGSQDQRQPVINQDGPKTAETGSSEEEDSWLSKMNLVCFAEFTTVRCSFTLEEEGVQIDLDQADFGYHVGEIEVLVPEGEDVGSALEKIEKTAQKLGLTGDQRVEGKMTVYLKRYCTEQYAKLLSAHIL